MQLLATTLTEPFSWFLVIRTGRCHVKSLKHVSTVWTWCNWGCWGRDQHSNWSIKATLTPLSPLWSVISVILCNILQFQYFGLLGHELITQWCFLSRLSCSVSAMRRHKVSFLYVSGNIGVTVPDLLLWEPNHNCSLVEEMQPNLV